MPKYLTETKVYTSYCIMLAFIPTPFQEVHFAFELMLSIYYNFDYRR